MERNAVEFGYIEDEKTTVFSRYDIFLVKSNSIFHTFEILSKKSVNLLKITERLLWQKQF